MTVQRMDQLLTDYEGKFPFYAWQGGYPIVYLTEGGEILCADCATREILAWRENESDDPPIAHGVHWEGPPDNCADCNRVLESAYGDPDDDNGEGNA